MAGPARGPMAGPARGPIAGGPNAGAGPAGWPAVSGSAAVGEAPTATKSAGGKVRTANLVHRPAPTGIRVGVGAVVLILLVIIPGILVLRAGGNNPAVDQLNALKLPSWSAQHPVDHASGSRWCFGSCMITERTWDSDRPVDKTAAAYAAALREAGWSPVGQCPKFPAASRPAGCWTRTSWI